MTTATSNPYTHTPELEAYSPTSRQGVKIVVTRKSLILLTAITLGLFAVAGIIGNHEHGVLQVIANIAWWSFVVCAIVLIAASAATLRRHRSRATRSS
jgi:hypothetical protein